MSRDLAKLVFPEISKSTADYEEAYPRRLDSQGREILRAFCTQPDRLYISELFIQH